MTPQKDRILRRFTVSGSPFCLEPEQKQKLAHALCGGDAPDKVIDEVEEAIATAHRDTRFRTDSPRSVSKEGHDQLLRIESLTRQLEVAFRDSSEEVQHYLRFMQPQWGEDEAAMLGEQVARLRRRHEKDLAKRRSPTEGAPAKVVASDLALRLAPIWAKWSKRGWSRGGAWGRFVKLAFDIAGVEASGERQARKAAERFLGGETHPVTVRQGHNRQNPSSI